MQSEQYGCINMVCKLTMLAVTQKNKKKKFQKISSVVEKPQQGMAAEKGSMCFFWDKFPDRLLNPKWTAWNTYMYE